MKYVDIRKHTFDVDDYIIVHNPNKPEDSLQACILEVKDDTEDHVKLHLMVMKDTESYTGGNRFWYEIDRTGNPLLGRVANSGGPSTKQVDLDMISLEDAAMYHLMLYLRPFAMRGKGSTYQLCVEQLKLQGVIAKDVDYETGKKILKRVIKMFPDRLKAPGGGWVRLESTVGASRSSPENFVTTDRIVDKARLVKAVSTFVVELFESGALGPMSWKLD